MLLAPESGAQGGVWSARLAGVVCGRFVQKNLAQTQPNKLKSMRLGMQE